MFKQIVRHRAKGLYASLNEGDLQPMLDSFARRFAYTFVGSGHPLAGTRRNRDEMRAQLERVLRLFSGITFDVQEVVVAGPPWDTRVAVVADVSAELSDGSLYENDLVQLLRLRWGRVERVRTFLDTGRLSAAFDRLHRAGIAEAAAPPVS